MNGIDNRHFIYSSIGLNQTICVLSIRLATTFTKVQLESSDIGRDENPIGSSVFGKFSEPITLLFAKLTLNDCIILNVLL